MVAMELDLLAFPAAFTPDEEDGGFGVTFRDLPEAITQGDSIGQGLSEIQLFGRSDRLPDRRRDG